MRPTERGTILLEALVALTILATAGLALAVGVREALETTRRAAMSERRVLDASGFLEAVALWPAEDLDRHLGDRPNGPWRLVVNRPSRDIYEVQVVDSTSRLVLVTTSLFRPETAHDEH